MGVVGGGDIDVRSVVVIGLGEYPSALTDLLLGSGDSRGGSVSGCASEGVREDTAAGDPPPLLFRGVTTEKEMREC